jgi:hypothetical protein
LEPEVRVHEYVVLSGRYSNLRFDNPNLKTKLLLEELRRLVRLEIDFIVCYQLRALVDFNLHIRHLHWRGVPSSLNVLSQVAALDSAFSPDLKVAFYFKVFLEIHLLHGL